MTRVSDCRAAGGLGRSVPRKLWPGQMGVSNRRVTGGLAGWCLRQGCLPRIGVHKNKSIVAEFDKFLKVTLRCWFPDFSL